MVRHGVFRRTVAILALSWAGTAAAESIVSTPFQTGDVEKDLPGDGGKTVTVIPGLAKDALAQPKWDTDAGRINGNVIKDIRLSYDAKSDTLAVGVNFWGVAGNSDGTADGSADPKTLAQNGNHHYANLGGDKSIAVGFAPVTADGAKASPLVVAGVPADKSHSPTGSLDGFNVAASNGNAFLGSAFGTTMKDNLGTLAHDPSAANPDFEFTVKNFSKIPGLNALTNGFYVSAYAGTGSEIVFGKSNIYNTLVGPPTSGPGFLDPPTTVTPPVPPSTPEPTTILAWGLVAGAVACGARRRARVANRP